MFATLTFHEWDTLCTLMEHALSTDIPAAWPKTSYEYFDLLDDISEVHGDLMQRPTQPSTLTGGF